MWTVDDGIVALREHGAKITAQRIAILRSLAGRCDHPSADVIYKNLAPDYPTMSIATVYSAAQLFADAGLIKIITIDDKRVYFDPNTDTHGHFQCRACGGISDFNIDEEELYKCASESKCFAKIERTEILFYGVCSGCI